MFGLGASELVIVTGLLAVLLGSVHARRSSDSETLSRGTRLARSDRGEDLHAGDRAERGASATVGTMHSPEGVYRTPTLDEPPRAPKDSRVAWGVGFGFVGVLLALAAMWIAVATGIFAKPSVTTLVPVFPSTLSALGAASMARRLWCSRRRVIASVVGGLGVLALAGAGLAATDYVTTEEPTYPPYPPVAPWPFWRC